VPRPRCSKVSETSAQVSNDGSSSPLPQAVNSPERELRVFTPEEGAT
jgi:hypothetical protein